MLHERSYICLQDLKIFGPITWIDFKISSFVAISTAVRAKKKKAEAPNKDRAYIASGQVSGRERERETKGETPRETAEDTESDREMERERQRDTLPSLRDLPYPMHQTLESKVHISTQEISFLHVKVHCCVC